ncbi:HNH endonuclease [Pyxidicoccus parkwayensis]|uniref:HNH endonuclease n=1 Tax=Pyxidicoccus parkwayensis TaxID=2813578 RepID=A0ABX7NPB7_9BACT|nr:HNH endonuclease signature motif containing protein [Pyxidicoccus parkwaysis]QSQ19294.1 HNH endonuclease [Pyxidicoccus parkwaysis]
MPEVVNDDNGSLFTGETLLRRGNRVRIETGDGRAWSLFVTNALKYPAGCRAYFEGQGQIPEGPIHWAKVADHPFDIGARYSRSDVRRLLGDKQWQDQGGKWATGYVRSDGRYIIFANIETAGRTGHDYSNRWDEQAQELEWSGKPGARVGQPLIDGMLAASGQVLLFTRHDSRELFVFRGCGVAKSIQNTASVRVTWAIAKARTTNVPELEQLSKEAQRRGQAVPPTGNMTPQRRTTTTDAFERDSEVHASVMMRAKGTCEACLKPAPFHRDDGTPYLEMHHLKRLADGGPDTTDNAVAVCANCHRELHCGVRREQLLSDIYRSHSFLRRPAATG